MFIFTEHIRKLTIEFLCLFEIRLSNTLSILPFQGRNTLGVLFLTIDDLRIGMPRIELEFEFDMVFCFFGICLAPYAVFSTRIYLQHIALPVESDRPIHIVFVRPSVRSSVVSL